MRSGTYVRAIPLSLAIAICVPSFGAVRNVEDRTGTIACRALEAHASANPAVVAVIFHQQNKDDQARVGEMLRMHSGETVEIQIGAEAWTGATMFRLKSCFGRGLLLLPAGTSAMKEGTTFLLRVSSAAAKD